ncbi:MAG: cation transporter [Clostridia bacterium]|nr:cation transporter [Clostridia bacterium]
MKKSFKVKGIHCANCASKMEKAINALPDVDVAVVSFATGKVLLEAAEDKIDAVYASVEKLIKEQEPDWEILK